MTSLSERLAAAEQRRRERGMPPATVETTGLEQGMSGVYEGIADFLGRPVEAVAGAINLGARPMVEGMRMEIGPDGLPHLDGGEVVPPEPLIDSAFGGGDTWRKALAPVISDVEPQNLTQKILRRLGREGTDGALTTLTGTKLLKAEKPLRALSYNAAGDTAATLAGETTAEGVRALGGSEGLASSINLIASLLAGSSVPAHGAKIDKKLPAPPSVNELAARGVRRKEQAFGLSGTLTDGARARFRQHLDNSLMASKASPVRHPNAYDVVEMAKDRPHITLRDIDDTRFQFGRDVAGNANEAQVGVSMKYAVDDFVDGLTSRDFRTGDPDGAADLLKSGRADYRQAKKAEAVQNELWRGEKSAARAGTGGNEVNRIRQRIGRLLDNEVAPTKAGKRRGFTKDEIAKMDEISSGTRADNALRWGSRFSPTAGMLPGALAGGLAGASSYGVMSGNPLAAAGVLPGALGFLAKAAAEKRTHRKVGELLDIIRRGGTAPLPNSVSDEVKAALVSALISGGPQ